MNEVARLLQEIYQVERNNFRKFIRTDLKLGLRHFTKRMPHFLTSLYHTSPFGEVWMIFTHELTGSVLYVHKILAQ